MQFIQALNILLRYPDAVMVHWEGRSDRDIQYTNDKGAICWTCAFTVGGAVKPNELEKLKQKNEEGWKVYANLQSRTPLN